MGRSGRDACLEGGYGVEYLSHFAHERSHTPLQYQMSACSASSLRHGLPPIGSLGLVDANGRET